MTDYIKEILYTTSIQLNSIECSKCKSIDGLIKYKLKIENEKLCNKNGYVLENTLKLINRSIGKIVTHDNISMIEYNITMKLKVIYPCEKDIFTIKIDNITKMGIVGYLYDKDKEYNIETSPVLFIIPSQYIEDIDLYKIDMKLDVQVLQSRIKYKSKQIQVVCKFSE